MKYIYLLPLLFLLGCDAAQRSCSSGGTSYVQVSVGGVTCPLGNYSLDPFTSIKGLDFVYPTEICWEGVVYLQFPSGATVKVTPDGKPALCGEVPITEVRVGGSCDKLFKALETCHQKLMADDSFHAPGKDALYRIGDDMAAMKSAILQIEHPDLQEESCKSALTQLHLSPADECFGLRTAELP